MFNQGIYPKKLHILVKGCDFSADHSLSILGKNTYEALSGINRQVFKVIVADKTFV